MSGILLLVDTRDDGRGGVESILGHWVVGMKFRDGVSREGLLLFKPFELDVDVLRIVRRVGHLDDVRPVLRVVDGRGEEPVLPLVAGDGLSVLLKAYDVGALVKAEKLLHIIRSRLVFAFDDPLSS